MYTIYLNHSHLQLSSPTPHDLSPLPPHPSLPLQTFVLDKPPSLVLLECVCMLHQPPEHGSLPAVTLLHIRPRSLLGCEGALCAPSQTHATALTELIFCRSCEGDHRCVNAQILSCSEGGISQHWHGPPTLTLLHHVT